MTLLDNDQFLIELNKFFQNSRLGGPKSVSVTMKKYNGRTKPTPRNPADLHKIPQEHLCMFRAKVGNTKISTVVHAKEVNKFQLAYAAVLKSNMDSLKKREKEKKPRSTKTTAQ